MNKDVYKTTTLLPLKILEQSLRFIAASYIQWQKQNKQESLANANVKRATAVHV